MANETNGSTRLLELDVVKTLSLFFMILVHVGENLFSKRWEYKEFCPTNTLWQLFDGWSTVLAPALFMFAMGATMNLARNQEPRHWFSRAWKLIVAWFLLKAAYAYPLASRFAASVELSPWMYSVGLVLVSDIFFFAGAFFIYWGCLRAWRVPYWAIGLISLVIFIVGQFLFFPSEDVVWMSIMGNFTDSEDTTFPFVNWVLHPLLGMAWSALLLKAVNREKVYRIGLIASALVLLGGFAHLLFKYFGTGEVAIPNLDDAYVATPYTLIASFTFFVFFACLFYYILKARVFAFLGKACNFISVRLTDIYCIQWMIIPWLAYLLPVPADGTKATVPEVLGWTFLIFGASIFISWPLNRKTFARLWSCFRKG